MNRTAMKTLYLASAIGTLMLLGCSADVGQESSQQAGKSGVGGSRGPLSGLAGGSSTPVAGAGGTGGATPAGGATATGGSATTAGAGGAATGGSSGANALPSFAGFPFGGADSIGFAGIGGEDGITTTLIIDGFAGAGTLHTSSGGANGGNQVNFAGAGGTRIWISF
jgi:hypothetical protein